MKFNNTLAYIMLLLSAASLASASELWQKRPESFIGKEVQLGIGTIRSVKSMEGLTQKENFVIYEVVPSVTRKVDQAHNTNFMEPIPTDPISLVYVQSSKADEFEKEFKAYECSSAIRNPESFSSPDTLFFWSPPKRIKGMLWKLDDTYVLIVK